MNESQNHRGPDDGGLHIEPGLGLGHRRLSIIDLSNGHQPLYNQDRSVCVVYNGEIYNFPDLMKELQSMGFVFQTHCDTEVIVHAWRAWGEDCVKRFRGMFAFALWDASAQSLFMARDRIGIKPLYYADLPSGELIFASELKALQQHPNLPRRIDQQAVEDYFAFGYVPDPRSIYAGVHKLEPGHSMLVKRDGRSIQTRQYWELNLQPGTMQDSAELDEALIEQMDEAVRIRMIAEVPLGAFLSGGVDSSAVVSAMARSSGKPVDTCAISFAAAGFDESEYAQQIADRYGTRHHVEQVDANDFSLLDQLAGLYDEPFADSSALPTYRVCELARKHVTVALSGDGGDESFAGYRRHRWHALEENIRGRLPNWLRGPLFGAAGALYPKMDWAPKPLRAKTTLQALARSTLEAYLHSISVLRPALRKGFFSKEFLRDLQGYEAVEVYRRYADQAPADDAVGLVQHLDFKTYLPGDILTKVDRASMAHSLEVRVPLLDHQFVEWVGQLPTDLKLRGREGKYVFKRALQPHLPHDLMYRDKMGFSIPISEWFRGPLRDTLREAVLGERLAGTGFFNMDTLRSMVEGHQSGRAEHSAILWSLMMFDAFLKREQLAN